MLVCCTRSSYAVHIKPASTMDEVLQFASWNMAFSVFAHGNVKSRKKLTFCLIRKEVIYDVYAIFAVAALQHSSKCSGSHGKSCHDLTNVS